MVIFLILYVLFLFAIAGLLIASFWKIYKKAGFEGWEAIVPIYNIYILTKIVGKPWWWMLLCCIPYVGCIWAIWMFNLLSKSFGKNEGFTVGMVLLGFVFFPILAFGDATYSGPAGDPAKGIVAGLKSGLDDLEK